MLNRGETVFLECLISRSGFSSERVFRVTRADRDEHVGAAPVHYCWTRGGQMLKPDQPAAEEKLHGLVQAYAIANGGAVARVETPDGEAFEVPLASVRRRSDVRVEPYSDVPIGS